ncbi:MAG: hypothetical protein ABS87_09100 [Sphingomonas sp. SCN 67-18]|uniref:hypothetical protein n=1 Tax=uncultured Sphingomonas sp. TaxID=158754 RepID=UPI00086EF463|nr:hypothetical protein [Sphingomonas sp. SCN 67-18]ODU20841.1 MAG: hypothetical protein ABS87_09100 [Sphingomonas sp. SCN 67-18]
MNPFEMVVLIVAITAVASILRAKYGIRRDNKGNDLPLHDPDTARMREELRTLKERIAVLERLATEDTSSLDREIEKLRTRDKA